MNEKRKILQIIPANNVVAIFGNLENDSDQKDYENIVICMALIEIETNDPNRSLYRVEPVTYDDDCGSCLCIDFPNYKGLKHKD